jgi:hypothetical protein
MGSEIESLRVNYFTLAPRAVFERIFVPVGKINA